MFLGIPLTIALLILVGPFAIVTGVTGVAAASWPGLTARLLPQPRPTWPAYRPTRTAVAW